MPLLTKADLTARAKSALTTLLGRPGHALSRADRRVVLFAYVAAADRLQRGLPPLPTGKYSHWQGQPVVLHAGLLTWIADLHPKAAPPIDNPMYLKEDTRV